MGGEKAYDQIKTIANFKLSGYPRDVLSVAKTHTEISVHLRKGRLSVT